MRRQLSKQQNKGRSQKSAQPQSPLGYRIPLISLKHATAVAEHLNFRHAAATLGISQSSLSQRIKQLEKELGVLLFERRHRGVALTEAGQHFLEHIALGIGQLDHAIRVAGMISGGKRGRLRIGFGDVLISRTLANLLENFRASFPGIAIEIADGRSGDILRQIRERYLDIAFIAGAALPPDCHSQQLWLEPLVAVLPTHHALAQKRELSWADLSSETFLVRNDGVELRVTERVVHRFNEPGYYPDIRRFDVGRETLMRLVAEGFGIALAPGSAIEFAIPGVEFRRFAHGPQDAVPITAIWSPSSRSTPHRHFLELVHRHCRTAIAPIKL